MKNISIFKNLKNDEGFTIIETLVATLIFSIIAVIITGILSQSLKIQKRSSLALRIQENAITVLESMAREIRVSDIPAQDSNCATSSLTMVHPVDGTINYTRDSGMIRKTTGSTINFINSSDVVFGSLVFCIRGSALGDNTQTRVTIVASITDKGGTSKPINIETTITSRVIAN